MKAEFAFPGITFILFNYNICNLFSILPYFPLWRKPIVKFCPKKTINPLDGFLLVPLTFLQVRILRLFFVASALAIRSAIAFFPAAALAFASAAASFFFFIFHIFFINFYIIIALKVYSFFAT